MNDEERDLVFESAMEDHRAGLHGLASRTLRQLVQDGTENPRHWSYCGLLQAMTEGSTEGAVELCERAVDVDGVRTSELYVNLARVLSSGGRRREAIDWLAKGIAVHPDDERLKRELQHLVPRARPVIRALSRKHPLNKYLGIARTVGNRLWITFVPKVRRIPPPGANRAS
jgi:predicted Zn-dependent protease